jgi:hypothetical protein
MRKIIETLEAIIRSIEFVEKELGGDYIVSPEDTTLLKEALSEAIELRDKIKKEGGDISFKEWYVEMCDSKGLPRMHD